MRNGLLGSLAAVLAGAAVASAQAPYSGSPYPVQAPVYGPNGTPYGMPYGAQAVPNPHRSPYGPHAQPAPYGMPPGQALPYGPYGPPPGMPYGPGAPYGPPPGPPPMMLGPLVPGPYPFMAPPPGAPGGSTSAPNAGQSVARERFDPHFGEPAQNGAGDAAKKNGTTPAPESFVPGMPLWADDMPYPPEGHEPHFPNKGPRGPCFYGHLDYLYYWIRPQKIPTLLSIGPIGDPTSSAFPQGSSFDFDSNERQGVRFTQGVWFNRAQTLALEGTFLMFGQRAQDFNIGPTDSIILVRPFINAGTGLADFQIISEPGRSGSFEVDTVFRLWSAEANLRWEMLRHKCFHLDALFGFRYLELDEDINITSSTNIANITSTDLLSTDNTFMGGQLGIELEIHWNRFYVDLWGKLGLGGNRQKIVNQGNRVEVVGGLANVTPGGFLTQPSNIGEFTRSRFTVLPEVGVNAGFKLTEHIRLSVGYSVLYISEVVRPDGQIDTTIDLTQGVPAPPFQFRDTNFWTHGINAGIEFRY